MFAGLFCKKRKTIPQALAARGAFFAKGAKNASFEERAKVKVNTLEDESPRPSLFFTNKNHTFQAGCGVRHYPLLEAYRKCPAPERALISSLLTLLAQRQNELHRSTQSWYFGIRHLHSRETEP
ncbi:MAG: hypothetical protein H7834_02665 [Magnetococcus sp. YQC-9]